MLVKVVALSTCRHHLMEHSSVSAKTFAFAAAWTDLMLRSKQLQTCHAISSHLMQPEIWVLCHVEATAAARRRTMRIFVDMSSLCLPSSVVSKDVSRGDRRSSVGVAIV